MNIFQINFLRRRKGLPSVDKCIRIADEIFQFFLTFECVYLAVEQSNIVIILNAYLYIFSSDFVADGAEVEIL
jgi:sulfur transfer complex TusBCD TusB component (DsrH family)